MKAVKALTILTFFIAIFAMKTPAFAQESAPSLDGELSALEQTIDLYFEQMIALKTHLALNKQKITSQFLSSDDAGQVRFLNETQKNIIDALVNYRVKIEGMAENPEALEAFEKAKLQYNIIVVKSLLPRYEVVKTKFMTKLFVKMEPQFAEALVSREDALKLFFTQFETNEPTKDALNLNYRSSEILKVHNAITHRNNQLKESNIYQVYSSPKITTGAQESELYLSLIKGVEFKPNSESTPTPPAPKAPIVAPSNTPPLLETKKVAPDHFIITPTCNGLFGI